MRRVLISLSLVAGFIFAGVSTANAANVDKTYKVRQFGQAPDAERQKDVRQGVKAKQKKKKRTEQEGATSGDKALFWRQKHHRGNGGDSGKSEHTEGHRHSGKDRHHKVDGNDQKDGNPWRHGRSERHDKDKNGIKPWEQKHSGQGSDAGSDSRSKHRENHWKNSHDDRGRHHSDRGGREPGSGGHDWWKKHFGHKDSDRKGRHHSKDGRQPGSGGHDWWKKHFGHKGHDFDHKGHKGDDKKEGYTEGHKHFEQGDQGKNGPITWQKEHYGNEGGRTVTGNGSPWLDFVGVEPYTVRGEHFSRYKLSVKNSQVFSNDLFRAAPTLPPCGFNSNSSRTWVNIYNQDGRRLNAFCGFDSSKDLNHFWFAVPQGSAPPQRVYIELDDRQEKVKYKSNVVAIRLGN